MSAGLRFALPSPTLAASIPHPNLQCGPSVLAFLNSGISRRVIGGDPLRLTPVVAIPSLRRHRRKYLGGVVCYTAPLSPQTLQWVSAVSAAVLMFAKGTAIQKSFLVPLFALQAPTSIISWIKGDYGTWTAFLALLVRLFYFIPGQLELPFLAMLLVIVAPYETTNLRGTQAGVIVSLAIAGYLAFQHFSKVGSMRRAFDQGSIIATLAVICTVAVPCLFLL
ncbi:cold-regulated 413 inner membrane protein [Canna indica]|uniref:Cold-regulated 413 inner membrane protein n=1 Tax=Canna indica TaxID=4628 RepID=A0AAQ3KMN1_9LILI|nr:cold-regulated 413 inner membrane protein [Canna indica]